MLNVLNKITIKNLKLNKKRSLATIIAIILSTTLLVLVSSLYVIAIKSLVKFEAMNMGDYHVAFYELSKEDFNKIKQNKAFDKIYASQYSGCVKVTPNQKHSDFADITSCSESVLKKFVHLKAGRLPKKDNEILIPDTFDKIDNTNIKIGENITLKVSGQKRDENGKKTNALIDSKEKTYTIVGIIESDSNIGNTYTYNHEEFITYMDDNAIDTDDIHVFTKFKHSKIKNWSKITASLVDTDSNKLENFFKDKYKEKEESSEKTLTSEELALKEVENQTYESSLKYDIDVNMDMINLESDVLKVLFGNNVYLILAFAIAFIVLISVFCIKNSFNISISEKIKQYAILKSIGATQKQIRKNVFFEGIILGLIGIPTGILMGLLPLDIFIKILNNFLDKYWADDLYSGLTLKFEFSWIAIIISIIMVIITIFLSSIASARKASKLIIIDAIKNSSNIKIKAKKLKTPKLITKTFGIAGELSYKNLKRNKRKYRATIFAIVVSIIITIMFSSITNSIYNTTKKYIKDIKYNIFIDASSDSYNDELYNKFINITKFDNIKDYILYKGVDFSSNDFVGTDTFNEPITYVSIYSIEDEQYRKYIKELSLNYNETKNKAIFINTFSKNDYTKKIKLNNDKVITGSIHNFPSESKESKNISKKMSLEIACITDKRPFGSDMHGLSLIVNDKFYKNMFKDLKPVLKIYFNSSKPYKLEKEINELLLGYDYYLHNTQFTIDRENKFTELIAIFLYSFIATIALIILTSLINTITTGIELRKSEFATLKSIGMTNKVFNKMIRLETFFIGLKSLMFGVPIGIGLSYSLFKFVISPISLMEYKLPIMTISTIITIVFILIYIIMKYSISKTNKQNIIETIRNENI